MYGEAGGAEPAAAEEGSKGGVALGLVGYGSGSSDSDSDSDTDTGNAAAKASPATKHRTPAAAAGHAAEAAARENGATNAKTTAAAASNDHTTEAAGHSQQHHEAATHMPGAHAAGLKQQHDVTAHGSGPSAPAAPEPAVQAAEELPAAGDLSTTFSRGQR